MDPVADGAQHTYADQCATHDRERRDAVGRRGVGAVCRIGLLPLDWRRLISWSIHHLAGGISGLGGNGRLFLGGRLARRLRLGGLFVRDLGELRHPAHLAVDGDREHDRHGDAFQLARPLADGDPEEVVPGHGKPLAVTEVHGGRVPAVAVTHLGDPVDVRTKAHAQILAGRFGQVSVTTLHRIHATLMSALNTAVRRGLLTTNPAVVVELPRPERPEMNIWTAAQAAHFLHGSRTDPWHLLYRLLLVTGMRRGEALGLQWKDWSPANRALHVRRQLTLIAGETALGEPKSSRGIRTIHVDHDTAKLINQHCTRSDSSHHIFVDQTGEPLSPAAVSRRFISLTQQLGLPEIRLHDLRHTSASLGLEAAEPISQVSRRLGHSTIAITADIYTHVSSEAAQHAADTLAQRMGSQLRSQS